MESLEPRIVLDSAWQNALNPVNVNADPLGAVTFDDVVTVVQELEQPRFSQSTTGKLIEGPVPPHTYVDVDGDGFVSPIDVVRVLNALNDPRFQPACRFDPKQPQVFSVPAAFRPAEGSPSSQFAAGTDEFLGFFKTAGRSDILVATTAINRDAQLDVVALDSEGLRAHLGTERGLLGPARNITTDVQNVTSFAVGDFLGDDATDLVVVSASGKIVFFQGDGLGGFLQDDSATITVPGAINDIVAADFDLDGDADLAIALADRVRVLRNDGERFAPPVITNGSFDQGLAGWKTAAIGHGELFAGTVDTAAGVAKLIENNSFLTTLSQEFVVPPSAATLSFDLVSSSFDPVTVNHLPDAVDVSLLDASGTPLIATFAAHATSFMNIDATGELSTAEGVTVQGATYTVDLEGIAAGTKATFILDLVGNVPGTRSTAVVDNVRVTSTAMRLPRFSPIELDTTPLSISTLAACHLNEDPWSDLVTTNDAFDHAGFVNQEGSFQFVGIHQTAPVEAQPVIADSESESQNSPPAAAPIQPTKFYVVDGADGNIYHYASTGAPNGQAALADRNATARGITSARDQDQLWVVDDRRQVTIVDRQSSTTLGSWTASELEMPEGIATDGTDIWMIDAAANRIFAYANAASWREGVYASSSSFLLDYDNQQPTGLTTNGTVLWVTDDQDDAVYVYDTSGKLIGSWQLDARNCSPAGITMDSSNSTLWVVDRADHTIYGYAEASSLRTGRTASSSRFPLAANNRVPTDIADPVFNIQVGDVVVGEIVTPDQIDEYRFDVVAGQRLYFDVLNVNGQLVWTALSPSGKTLFSRTLRDESTMVIDESGEFTILINRAANRTGSYSFAVVDVPVNPVTQISMGQIAGGNIDVVGESFEFSFTGEAGQQVFFNVLSGGLSLQWKLTSPSGAELFSTAYADRGPLELPEDGTYALSINERDDRLEEFAFQLVEVPSEDPKTITVAELVSGDIRIPGQSDRYVFVASEGDRLYFDTVTGGITLEWSASSPSGDRLFSTIYIDQGPLIIPEDGTYFLTVSGRGDRLGSYAFWVWDVPNVEAQSVSIGEIIAESIEVPGGTLDYNFEAVQGQKLEFDLLYNEVTQSIRFSIDSPSGSRVLQGTFANDFPSTDYKFTASETGLYTVRFTSTTEGAIAFRLVEGELMPLQPTADLRPVFLMVPSSSVGDPAVIEVEWEVRNVGVVAVPAGTKLVDQFSLSANDVSERFAIDPPIIRFDTVLDTDLATGQSYRRHETITLPRGLSGEPRLALYSDFANEVFEGEREKDVTNNRITSTPIGVYPSERSSDITSIRLDIADGSSLPAGTELTLSGEVSRESEVTNLVFVVDVSGSTMFVTGLDANQDGLVDENDNLNGDERIGDVLDVAIASIIRISKWFDERIDDLLVSVIAFASKDPYGRGEIGSVPLDLGAEPYFQSFQDISSDADANGVADFEEAVSSLFVIFSLFNDRAGATKFREFRMGTGNDFGTAIDVLTSQISRAPSADATHVFFLTDGEPTTEGDVTDEQLDALASQGINWNGVQLTLGEISEPLIRATNRLESSSSSTGRALLVTDPTVLSDTVISSVEFAGVTVNGQPVESFDSSNRFSTPIVLEEGLNRFVITAVDAQGRTLSRSVELIGTALPGVEQRQDLTSFVNVEFTATTFNRKTSTLHAQLTVDSISVSAPLEASFVNFTAPAVTLANADSLGKGGQAIKQVVSLGTPVDVEFWNPKRDRFDFELTITGNDNSPPSFATIPDTHIRSGTNYSYLPLANDPDGDRLTYSLVTSPNGMVIDRDSGRISWLTDDQDIGSHAVALSVTDVRGGSAVQTYRISVVDAPINNSPLFSSSPITRVDAGATYLYQAIANDIDGDSLAFSLSTTSADMTIDPQSGKVTWLSATAGEFEVGIRVEDGNGGVATQEFVLSVGALAVNLGTPQILSTASTVASVDVDYFYPVIAVDSDNDPLTYSLPLSPAGMTIDSTTGVVRWTPSNGDVGVNAVLVRVEDGQGGVSTQLFSINVAAVAVNRSPVFLNTPIRIFTVGEALSDDLDATDPDGDVFRFAVTSGPDRLEIDPDTGVLVFTPGSDQLGAHRVELTATDSNGAIGKLSYVLDVRPANTAPQFVSEPVTSITAGNRYIYQAVAMDSADRVTYRVADGPEGFGIDAFTGQISFPTDELLIGQHPIVLRAEDERGAISEQVYTLTVTADQQPPQVSVVLGSNLLKPGETTTIRVVATDNVSVNEISLSVNGVILPLDEFGVAGYTATNPGLVNLIGTAEDAAGNAGVSLATIRIIDPQDSTRPEVEITSPASNAVLDYLTPIIGSVIADDLEYYRVEIARFAEVDLNSREPNDPAWRLIAEGFEEVRDGTLAVLDPTVLQNDIYAVRVVAMDTNGNGWAEPLLISIEGQAKIGEFAFEVTDLSVPLAGIPVEITRRYSSYAADTSADFGYGWSLDVAAAEIRETVPIGNERQSGLFGASAFIYGTKVYLTNPEGRRVGFTFEPTATANPFLGTAWHPHFTPDPGVTDRLEVPDMSLTQRDDGTFGIYLLGFNYNPSSYTLITKDQTRYTYDQFAPIELKTIENSHGTVLTVDALGIHGNDGTAILWQRDAFGRITTITDPAGNKIAYEYSSSGHLISVTDQVGNVTRMTYLDAPSDVLSSVIDPRGIEVLSLDFDAQGRLVAQSDAMGNSSRLTHDVGAHKETVADLRGNLTTLIFDDRGNVLQEIDAKGNVTIREYHDPRNPDAETKIIDRRGFVTEQQFDARGNLLKVSKLGHQNSPFAQPVVTAFTYNANNDVTSVTDANGHTTTFRYEGANLVEIVNALGDAASMTYFANGDVKSFTDFNGNTTEFSDYLGGQPRLITYADGTQQKLEYNQFGQITYEAYLEANGAIAQERRSVYDKAGRLIEESTGSDVDGSQTVRKLFYDGNLLDWEILVHPDSLDAQGNLLESPATPVAQRKSSITDYVYDVGGRLISQIDAEDGVIDFRYDAQGNRIALRDPVGNITTWVYDSLNRPVEERDPLYWNAIRQLPQYVGLSDDAFLERVAPVVSGRNADPLYDDPSGASCDTKTGAPHVRLTCYDAEGNQSFTIDRNGRRREFGYDFDGNLLQEQWFNNVGALLRTIGFTYDAVGNMLTAIDPDSSYEFFYDALGQMLTADNAGTAGVPHVVLSYGHDAQGNVISVSDNYGVTVASVYNRRNLLGSRTWTDEIVPLGDSADISPLHFEFQQSVAGRTSQILRYASRDTSNLVGKVSRTYDRTGRSTGITFTTAVDQLLADYDFGYDALGRMEQDSRAGISATYTHDLTGQLLSATRSNGNNERFSYDANGNRNLPGYVTGPGNRLLSDGTFNYEYDGEGNRITRTEIATGKVTRYEYDHRNLLLRVTEQEPGGEVVEVAAYTYDVLNRRLVIKTAEGTTITVHDRDQAWVDFDGAANVTSRYLYDDQIDMLLAMAEAGQEPLFVNTDLLGSVVGYVSNNGALVGTVAYEAFGGLATGSDLLSRFGFTGREWTSAEGLYSFRARFYDLDLGLFVSQDTLRFASEDPNMYRYSYNLATMIRDPSGKVAVLERSVFEANFSLYSSGLIGGFAGSFFNTTIGFVADLLEELHIPDVDNPAERRIEKAIKRAITKRLQRLALAYLSGTAVASAFRHPAVVGFKQGFDIGSATALDIIFINTRQ